MICQNNNNNNINSDNSSNTTTTTTNNDNSNTNSCRRAPKRTCFSASGSWWQRQLLRSRAPWGRKRWKTFPCYLPPHPFRGWCWWTREKTLRTKHVPPAASPRRNKKTRRSGCDWVGGRCGVIVMFYMNCFTPQTDDLYDLFPQLMI